MFLESCEMRLGFLALSGLELLFLCLAEWFELLREAFPSDWLAVSVRNSGLLL